MSNNEFVLNYTGEEIAALLRNLNYDTMTRDEATTFINTVVSQALMQKISEWKSSNYYEEGVTALFIVDSNEVPSFSSNVIAKCNLSHTSPTRKEVMSMDESEWHDYYSGHWEELLTISNGGSSGDPNITVDQTYKPGSKNAQSGKAVAEAIFPKIELWRTETLYKAGSIVIAKLFNGETNIYPTVIMVCKQEHISPDSNFPNEDINFDDNWEYMLNDAVNSMRSNADEDGRNIKDTYATQEQLTQDYVTRVELNSKIGYIETELDNIIEIQNSFIGGNE